MTQAVAKAASAKEVAAAFFADKLRDEAEENFKQFVLYIKDGDANSAKALRLLKASPRLTQCVVQEVGKLALPRPTWLVSVPTLVDRHAKVVKRGTAAIEQLTEWAALAPTIRSAGRGYSGGGFDTPD